MFLFVFCCGVVFGWWSVSTPMFPDPYHSGDNVTFFVWCYRELDELLHGEK